MAADEFNYDDLADLRYNSFANEGRGEYYPKTIGFGITDSEERTISSISPFIISLFESPLQTVPSSVEITLKSTGEILKEVSKGDPPANKQYAINYEEEGNGQVFFNSGQAGQIVYINYKGLGTIHQRSTLKFQILGSSTTKIVASSDSSIGSQDIADEIILTSEDAGLKINNIITNLNSNGGGEVKILEGTYNFSTGVNLVNDIVISGVGKSTELKKIASIDLFSSTNKSNIMLKNFYINGNGYAGNYIRELGTFAYLNKCENINIYSANQSGTAFNRYICNNCYVDGVNIGFDNCNFVSNCYIQNTDSYAFSNCDQVINCYGYDTDEGAWNCNFVNNCQFIASSVNLINRAFSNCDQVINCKAIYCTLAYEDCNRINNCFASLCWGNGYETCNYITNSYADNCGQSTFGSGFFDCEQVVNCESTNNAQYGFNDCKPMQTNRATGNGTAEYNNCFSDRAGLLAVADNANGGFNG